MKDMKLDIVDQVYLIGQINKIMKKLDKDKRTYYMKKVDCDKMNVQIDIWKKLLDVIYAYSENKQYHSYIFHVDSIGEISDGSHSFNDLYMQRSMLFATICNMHKDISWKSWNHHHEEDFPMYEDYFVVGINTPEGQYSYHCHKDWWDTFDVPELEEAPMYDGHMPDDVGRLLSLIKKEDE